MELVLKRQKALLNLRASLFRLGMECLRNTIQMMELLMFSLIR